MKRAIHESHSFNSYKNSNWLIAYSNVSLLFAILSLSQHALVLLFKFFAKFLPEIVEMYSSNSESPTLTKESLARKRQTSHSNLFILRFEVNIVKLGINFSSVLPFMLPLSFIINSSAVRFCIVPNKIKMCLCLFYAL